METDHTDSLIKIPEIKSDCHFWMIRTNDGVFFNEFISKQFIAIGWNLIKQDMFPLSKTRKELLEDEIKDKYKTNIPGMAISKCEKFCFTLQKGDIGVITGKDQIAFAVIGDYYEESPERLTERLEISINQKVHDKLLSSETKECPYCKRRKVDVISIIHDREKINPYLYKAMLLNKHSLSSLNQYSDTILSSCYDIYFWKGVLSFSFRIQTQDNISAIVLSNFIGSFASLLKGIEEKDISVKTALHSPGDVVLQIGNWLSNSSNYLWVFVILMALFGGKIGSIEFPSIWNVIKYFIERYDNQVSKQLDEEKRLLENKRLQEEITALQLDNDKKRQMEAAVQCLSQACDTLEIRPISKHIIDIDTIKAEIENNLR